jgi:hypothetical protein
MESKEQNKVVLMLENLSCPDCAKKIGIYKGKLYGVTTGMNTLGCYYIPQDFQDAVILN